MIKLEGDNNFIIEVFFLIFVVYYYGSEVINVKFKMLDREIKYFEKNIVLIEVEWFKVINWFFEFWWLDDVLKWYMVILEVFMFFRMCIFGVLLE